MRSSFPLRAAAFLFAVALLHLLLAPLLPLWIERRHFAVPLAWALDWALFVRPNLPESWKRWRPALAVLFLALGVANWMLVLEGARHGEGWAGSEEWVWKCALSLSIMAHWSLLARVLASAGRLARVPCSARVALTAGLATLALLPYAFTILNTHRARVASGRTPSALGLPFESVRFASGPLELRGWWIPAARPTRRCILVCHGVSSNMGQFLGAAPFLHRAGFNVLFFDFRGHGQSAGHTTSFGWHESQDVRAAVKYLARRGQDRIALYGFSMGGASANLAFDPRHGKDAAFDSNVRAVVVDSTFARLAPLLAQQLGFVPGAWRPSLLRALSWCSLYEVGARPEQIAPGRVVARIAPRPMLIIHGDRDRLIPLAQSLELFEAAREPKQRVVVRGAEHCLCRKIDPAPYEKRVAAWLLRALR